MATTTLSKSSSGNGTRTDAIGDLKGHESVPRTSNDGSDDSRCEKMAPDCQKVETSPESRNPGKTQVDPAFEDLSSPVQEFLQAQGITSAMNFMATNATELAPAWIEWNKGAFKTSNNGKAKSDVLCWKRKVRDRWYSNSTKEEATPHLAPVPRINESDASVFLIAQGIASSGEAFLLAETEPMANALVERIEQTRNEQSGFIGARMLIKRWKRKSREQKTSIWGQPLAQLDTEFQTLSPTAKRFLASQGIATAEAFLSMNITETVNALMTWRNQEDRGECSISAARQCIYIWKKRLRERQSSQQEASRELDHESYVLSSIISDWQQILQERITRTEIMYGALSYSATPSVATST